MNQIKGQLTTEDGKRLINPQCIHVGDVHCTKRNFLVTVLMSGFNRDDLDAWDDKPQFRGGTKRRFEREQYFETLLSTERLQNSTVPNVC